MRNLRRSAMCLAAMMMVTGVGVMTWLVKTPATASGHDQGEQAVASMVERLRDRVESSDVLPFQSVEALREIVVVDHSRLLSGGEARFFVVPGVRGDVCVVGAVVLRNPTPDHSEDVAVTCSSSLMFADRGVYLSLGEHDAHHAVLVLPDSVRDVHLPATGETFSVVENHVRLGPFAFGTDPLDDDAEIDYGAVVLVNGDRRVEVPVPQAALQHRPGHGR